MKVKICGVCRPEDGSAAAAAGADYVGVILGAASPRLRDPVAAEAIYRAAGVARAGVFADAPVEAVVALARDLHLDVIQLHGAESEATIGALRAAGGWAVWKAIRPRTAEELRRDASRYAALVDGLLVDGWSADALGGSGAAAPWSLLRGIRDHIPASVRLILAGGLTPGNVSHAIEATGADVVDVSSGVEHAVGEKSAATIRAFISAARGNPHPKVEA